MRWPPQRRVAASASALGEPALRPEAARPAPESAPTSRPSSQRWWQGVAARPAPGSRLAEVAREAARASPLARSIARVIAAPLLAYGVFTALALVYAAPEWRWGLIAHQDDTRLFYYPVMAAVAAALRQGSLSLWAPGLFGGYPLFADGGVGVLYPPHFLLLRTLSAEQALVWLRVLHLFLAGAFTFHYVRLLGLGTFGGLVAGLTFAYGGFFAAQVVHANLSEAAVWLPLALYGVERARRTNASAWAILAGVAVGIQGLAVHINISLMTALFVTLYALVVFALLPGEGRPVSPRRWLTRLPGRVARGAWVVALLGGVAFGIAAVQLLPLYELGSESFRSHGLSSRFAAVNSVAPVNLATLLLPNLFGGTLERPGWGLWVPWETAIYVGVLPLLLALLALFARPRFYVLLYGLVAALALLMAFGDLGPWPLWERLRLLPLFNTLQSPGRFGLFFTLAVAVLAAYGATDLAGRAQRAPARGLSLRLVGCGLAVGGLVYALLAAGAWVAARRDVVESGLARFLAHPGAPRLADGVPLSPSAAYDRLLAALAPNGAQVDGQVRLLVAGLVVLVGWHAASRLAAIRAAPAGLRAAVRLVGQAALLLVIAVDLLGFGQSYHPRASFASLRPHLPPPLAQPPPLGEGRVFTRPDPTRRFAAAPNALLPTGWEEVTGFTSLESDRHARYVAQVARTDNHLLDLLNARYVLDRGKLPDLPVYDGVPYNPGRPLVSGTAANPGARAVLAVGKVSSHEIGLVSWLVDAADAPQDAEVGKLVVTDAAGATYTLPLRAGQQTADRDLAAVPAERGASHRPAVVAEALPTATDDGRPYSQQRYYGRLALPRTVEVVRVEVQYTWPRGMLEVFGLAPLRPDGLVEPIPPKERYRWLYGDDQWLVAENTTALPRAFLVSSVQMARQDQDVLAWMADGPFDPRQLALVERGEEQDAAWPGWQLLQDAPAGEARLEQYRPEEIVVRTVSATDGFLVLLDPFFPGWRATVDGLGSEIYRTDYLFRGVFVPAGDHVVRFVYEPVPFRLGAALSLLTILALLGAAALALARRWPLHRPVG